MGLELRRINKKTAQNFYFSFEHLGNCGLGVWHWGGFHNGQLVSSVSFGTTCFGGDKGLLCEVSREFDMKIYQLCRGGTIPNAPKNCASQTISRALKELRSLRGDCLIVAFADKDFNEIGTIYQACNGLYTGLTNPKGQSKYKILHKTFSGWEISKKYGTRSLKKLKMINKNIVRIQLTKKFRYVFVETSYRKKKKILHLLENISQSYPKRSAENIPQMDIQSFISKRKEIQPTIFSSLDDDKGCL
jgi:hypothetical protein